MDREFSNPYNYGMPEAQSSEDALDWHDRGAEPRAHLRRGGFAVLCLLFLASGGATTPPLGQAVAGALVENDWKNAPRPISLAADLRINGESDAGFAPAKAVFLNASRPLDGALERVSAFHFLGDEVDLSRAVDCLAAAAYYEAGDDPAGQRAVVQVVLNRVRHPAYPNTICGVVFEGSERTTGCQFTFTCDGSMGRNPSPGAWLRARVTAHHALAGRVDSSVGSATHYHADYVLPFWSGRLRKIAVVGAHIFYRFPGAAGASRAMAAGGGRQEMRAGQLSRLSPFHSGAVAAAGSAEALLDPQALSFSAVEIPDALSNGLSARHPGYSPAMHMSTPSDVQQPGRWAVDALRACSGKDECQVALYSTGDQVSANYRLAPTDRGKPLFLFVRDGVSGTEIALWNCEQISRPTPSECLSADRAVLSNLLRSRG